MEPGKRKLGENRSNIKGPATHHFQRTPQDATEHVRIPKLVLCSAIIWQFNEIRQWVFFKNQRELLIIRGPIRHGRGDVQKDLEPDLFVC